jgi:hypothetical protein
MSYYNDFLKPDQLKYLQTEKNRTGEIVQMTPREYYEDCAKYVFDMSVDELLNSRKVNEETIAKYRDDMKNGDVFPLCFINYADKSQEGLHRMLAAGEEFGWNIKYPVLAITAVDEDLEERWKAEKDLEYHFKWGFRDDLNKVKELMKTKYNPNKDLPPESMTQILQRALYDITDKKLKARVYVDYADVDDDMLLPESVHFEPVVYDDLNVSDYIDPQYYAKNFYIFVEDMFYFPVDDPDEMEQICQPIYDDAEV